VNIVKLELFISTSELKKLFQIEQRDEKMILSPSDKERSIKINTLLDEGRNSLIIFFICE
jgi:hypothetical protein